MPLMIMPTPRERRISKIPLIGKPIKRGFQLDRLAQKERIRRPEKYVIEAPLLTRGGMKALNEYARSMNAARRARIDRSKKVIIGRAKKMPKKKGWYDASAHSNYGEREDSD